MSKKHYAVIGHPIGHTMSPFIHKRLFELSGVDADYGVLDIAPENLAAEYENTLKKLDGYNITIPHKQSIIPFLDEIDGKAEMYGSVNTVFNRGGLSKGFTTDPDGFIKAIEAAGIKLEGRIMILGCGGVARTMAYEIALRGLEFEFAVRRADVGAAGLLCLDITKKIPGAKVSFGLIDQIIGTVDVLINATPIGMYPNVDGQPIHNCAIGRCKSVFDAVYNPLETVLVKRARANGAVAEGGMSMLVWQAVVSHEHWDGSVFAKEDIDALCLDAAKELASR
ncbi:MAG TPA: shikimate dehydrogenase [Ruminococcaceae bacterium]|nr:shikimate dehydrogenase [Oscillospiraceae bacterium]